MEETQISQNPETNTNQKSPDIQNAVVAIDPYSLQNETEVPETNQTHHAIFYQSDGKSLPNFPAVQFVPRSASTNVHVDANDLKFRDEDSLTNNDKYMANETSSTISSHSNFSAFSFPTNSNFSNPNTTASQEIDSPKKPILNSPPKSHRKDPKIPEVFTRIQSPKKARRTFNVSSASRLSYSWPKYQIEESPKKPKAKHQASTHLYETAVTKFRKY